MKHGCYFHRKLEVRKNLSLFSRSANVGIRCWNYAAWFKYIKIWFRNECSKFFHHAQTLITRWFMQSPMTEKNSFSGLARYQQILEFIGMRNKNPQTLSWWMIESIQWKTQTELSPHERSHVSRYCLNCLMLELINSDWTSPACESAFSWIRDPLKTYSTSWEP